MSYKLRNWGSAVAVAFVLCAVSSCTKKAENTAQTPPPSSSVQSAPQPTPTPGATPASGGPATTPPANPAQTASDKMAPTPTEPAPAPVAQAELPPPPPPQPEIFTIPAGASVSVRTISSLSTKTNKTGEPFSATLAAPLVVNGVVIARTGSNVAGTVVNSDPGGRVKGVACITLGVTSITTVDNQRLRVSTSPFEILAKSTKKKDAAKIGGAAALGTVVGAIAGGGKGAAIGAAVGGAGGTGVVLATRGDPAVLPSESIIKVRLSNSLRVTERAPGTINKQNAPQAVPPPAN